MSRIWSRRKRHGQHRFAGQGTLLMALLTTATVASAQSTGLPWTSTWDEANWNVWHGFRNATGVTIESSGCQSGRCVRAPLTGGTTNDNYGDFHFGDHTTVRGAKVEEVWLQLYSKFDAGMIWPDRSQKIAIINLGDTTSLTRYFQVYVYVRPNGQYAVDHSDLINWRFFGLFQNVGAAVSPRPGQWDKLKLYVRLNAPGQENGVVRLWVNDELKVERTDVNIRQNGSTHGMNKLNLSSYTTNGGSTTGGTGVQWWDSFTLSSTDPDVGARRPSPPTNLRAQ